MRRTLIFFYSIYCWLICYLWMAILCFITYLLLPIFPYKKTHSVIAAPGFAFVLWLMGCPTKITYDPKFDKDRRSVFCQNHVNLLDAFIASKTIPHVFCGLMLSWQFKIPIYGWMMFVSKGIPVHDHQRGTIHSIEQAAIKRKEMGFSILTFPEGRRTRDGEVQQFKRGVLFMARNAGYPVVPIAVEGNFEVNQKGSRLFRPGKINVYVGSQIETKGLSDEKIYELAKTLEGFVRNKIKEMKEVRT